MLEERSEQPRNKLISIERQYETDVSTGETEIRIFIKFYLEARDSGLLAALSDRMCRTLICLATYMDENGNCHPSQDELARQLGVRRENVNLRVQELLAFRFNGRPVISVEKTRVQTADGGRWAKNRYRIHPVSGFAIFDQNARSKLLNAGENPCVRKNAHRPVCEKPNIGNAHTNQNQRTNQTVNSLATNDQESLGRKGSRPLVAEPALRARYALTDAQLAQVHYLVEKQGDVLGSADRNHRNYVKRAAEAVAADCGDLFDVTLSEFKQATGGRNIVSRPAYFTPLWEEKLRIAQNRPAEGSMRTKAPTSQGGGFRGVGEILRESKGHRTGDPPGDSLLA